MIYTAYNLYTTERLEGEDFRAIYQAALRDAKYNRHLGRYDAWRVTTGRRKVAFISSYIYGVDVHRYEIDEDNTPAETMLYPIQTEGGRPWADPKGPWIMDNRLQ